MKADVSALALRLTLAWLVFSLVVLFLALVGAAQSFLEAVQEALFQTVRGLSWTGLLASWFLLVPLARHRRKRWLAGLVLGAAFAGLFAFVLFWGSWIYPASGRVAR